MKITLFFLLLMTAFLSAEVGNTSTEREAAELVLKGDASALAGNREEAQSIWGQVLSLPGAGVEQILDAKERLNWARPENGIGGLASEKPGKAFALFRRNSFLGANNVQRQRFIREFCDDINHIYPHPELDAYAVWLQKMLAEDKNFELLPLILEGDLAGSHWWLAQFVRNLSDYDFLLDPDRALEVVKLLGGKAGDGFNAKIHDEVGESFMFRIIDELAIDPDGGQDKHQHTREALKKFFCSQKVTTLDSDLMLTLLQWDDDKALAKFLTKHGSNLAVLEPEHQKAMLQMLMPVKGCPKTGDMDEILYSGDACALAGERDKAMAFWRQVMTLAPTGIVLRQDAKERLEWASPKGNIETWGPENVGQVFANHMRDSFLGKDSTERKALIESYGSGNDGSGKINSKFEHYSKWLEHLLMKDKNLELLPLILEGGLADNKRWLAVMSPYLVNNDSLNDPLRFIKAMEGLGFLDDSTRFRCLSLGEYDRQSVFEKMIITQQNISDKESRNAIKKHFMELRPRTFGADLALAMLEENEDGALASFLKSYSAQLARMGQPRRSEILAVFKTKLRGYPYTEEMDDSVVSVLQPLLPNGELNEAKLEDRLTEILTVANQNVDSDGDLASSDDVARLISNVAIRSPDKAIEGLKKAIEIIRDHPRQKSSDYAASEKPMAWLFRRLLFNPKLFNFVLHQSDKEGLLADTSWMDTTQRYSAHAYYYKFTGQQVVTYYLSSNILVAEAESFNPLHIYSLYGYGSKTILGMIADQFFTRNDRLRGETLNALRKQQPRTFGSEMAEIMISHDKNAIMDFIRRRSPEFAKIPAARRGAVKDALFMAWEDLPNPEALSPELQTLLQPLLARDPAEINRQFEQIMRVPSFASMNLRPESGMESALVIIDDLSKQDVQKAMRLADKVRELIARHPENSPRDKSFYIETLQTRTAAVPELFGIYTKEFENHDGASKPRWMIGVSDQLSSCSNLPMRSLKMLRAGRFLDEAPSFHSYRIEHDNITTCWLEMILGHIKQDDQAVAAATDFLNNQKPTFGVHLVKALLDDKPDSLPQFISRRSADLEKIPFERHSEITFLCGIRFGSWLQLASVSEKWNKALQTFLPGHKIRIAQSCHKILAATRLFDLEPRLNELDLDQGDPWLRWLNVISEMMIIDPGKAGRAFEHLMRLADVADQKLEEAAVEKDPSATGERVYAKSLLTWAAKFPVLLKSCISAAKSAEKPLDIKDGLSRALEDIAGKPVEACLLLESAGFLTDAANFDPTLSIDYLSQFSSGGFSSEELILSFLTDPIHLGIYEDIKSYLTKRRPQTFGSDFIQALLNEDGSTGVSAFLKAHQADIARLPAASRKPVMDMLRKAWPKMPPL